MCAGRGVCGGDPRVAVCVVERGVVRATETPRLQRLQGQVHDDERHTGDAAAHLPPAQTDDYASSRRWRGRCVRAGGCA